MIPKLFPKNETGSFNSEGLGRLTECTSCKVTEERNGIYECEFTYPISGALYSQIKHGSLIACTHDETGDVQPFIVYRISKPLNGLVTFYAHHISYNLSNYVLSPYTAGSCAAALNGIASHTVDANMPFQFWTDKLTQAAFKVESPVSARSILGGVAGSILDVYGGGEYKFDKYTVMLYQNRGADHGVEIRYGKNLIDITDETDTMDLYDSVVPFWKDSEGTVIHGGIVTGTDSGGPTRTVAMDLSDQYETAPTADTLEDRALTILNSRKPWIPKRNIKVDFVALWQTEEYKDIAVLERVNLCDTVTVIYPELDVNAKSKVIRTVYNVLLDRYDEIELGEAQTSFAEAITAHTEELLADVPTVSIMQAAIDHATELITGGQGGHVVFRYDADGKPTEILVMDTEDEATAVNVLRINVNGIGFSKTGVNGPFTTAWTIDGRFVADFITAGTLNAALIKAGVLSDAKGNNSWDMTSGVLSIKSGSIELGGRNFVLTSEGVITIKEGLINLGNNQFIADDHGSVTTNHLTVRNYVSFNGGTGSTFKIVSGGGYVQMNDSGFEAKNGYSVYTRIASSGYIYQPSRPGSEATDEELDAWNRQGYYGVNVGIKVSPGTAARPQKYAAIGMNFVEVSNSAGGVNDNHTFLKMDGELNRFVAHNNGDVRMEMGPTGMRYSDDDGGTYHGGYTGTITIGSRTFTCRGGILFTS